MSELTFYRDLLGDIKRRISQAQNKAFLSINTEMIMMYWDIGRIIFQRQKTEGWGAGVIPRLSRDLHNELPEQKGFSERNIKFMVQLYKEYEEFTIGKQTVSQLEERKNFITIFHCSLPFSPGSVKLDFFQTIIEAGSPVHRYADTPVT